MRSERKDLPAARSKSTTDLKAEFTYEELMQECWGEIDAKRKVFPDRQEGDIDRMQWAERYHISITAAITQMKQFVKENELASSGYPVFLFGTSGKYWKVPVVRVYSL